MEAQLQQSIPKKTHQEVVSKMQATIDGLNVEVERIKGEWKCHESGCDGFLEIFTYNKVGNTWYYRICSAAPFCKNRTKAQKYSTTVKGIMRKDKENK